MQLHIEYSRITNILRFAQMFQSLIHMPIAHSVQSAENVSAYKLQQHDPNLMQNDTIALSMNS